MDRHDEISGRGARPDHTCEEIAPLLSAAALGALDEPERSQVEQHLDWCPRCQAAMAREQRIVDLLPLTVPQHQPPDALRARTLAALAPEPTPLLLRARVWVAAAAAVLLLFLLGGNLLLWSQLQDARTDLQAIEERRAQLASAPMVWFDLAADQPGADARGTLCAVENGDIAWLIVYRLPTLPADATYQAWLVTGETRVDAGVFTVDEQGRGFLTIWLDQPLESFDALGVTTEPAGGSPAPTGPRMLIGTL